MTELPSYQDIELALWDLLKAKGSMTPRRATEQLAIHFGLTDQQRALKRKDGRGPLFENHVQWARESLAKKRIISRQIAGFWQLTGPARLIDIKPQRCSACGSIKGV